MTVLPKSLLSGKESRFGKYEYVGIPEVAVSANAFRTDRSDRVLPDPSTITVLSRTTCSLTVDLALISFGPTHHTLLLDLYKKALMPESLRNDPARLAEV